MAIIIKTTDANKLLSFFKKGIDEGKIVTWSYDQDGDFSHTPDQWKNKAWLRPQIKGGDLVLSILKPQNITISSLVYAVYHGRFIESMLNHCDQLFTDISATALPREGDRVS